VRRATPVALAHASQSIPHSPCAPGARCAHRHLGGAGTAGRRGSAEGASALLVRAAGMVIAAGGSAAQAFDSLCCPNQFRRGWVAAWARALRSGSAEGASALLVRAAGMVIAAGGSAKQAFDSLCCPNQFRRGWVAAWAQRGRVHSAFRTPPPHQC
jgi:hypothetical protein